MQDAALFGLFQRGDQVQRIVRIQGGNSLGDGFGTQLSATSSRIVSSSSVRMTGSNVGCSNSTS